eukprot:3108836-Alexandrium_andersonii.AAC.1
MLRGQARLQAPAGGWRNGSLDIAAALALERFDRGARVACREEGLEDFPTGANRAAGPAFGQNVELQPPKPSSELRLEAPRRGAATPM